MPGAHKTPGSAASHFHTPALCTTLVFCGYLEGRGWSLPPTIDLTDSHLKALGLLSPSGRLDPAEKVEDAHPKLWCALNEGKVVVFDASSWTVHQHCFKVGSSKVVSATPLTQCDAQSDSVTACRLACLGDFKKPEALRTCCLQRP